MIRIIQAIGILTLLGIVSASCSSTKDLSNRPLYSIDKYRIEGDIQGTLFREQLLIVKELGPKQQTLLTLEKYVHRAQAMYSLDVYYVGPEWKYMKDITMNIDGEIKTLTDEDPVRIRKSGDTVIESLTCLLDRDAYMGLRHCKLLDIQYDQKPISIPQEGLEAIWKFLRE